VRLSLQAFDIDEIVNAIELARTRSCGA